MCSVQLIFFILRHTFISKASNLVMSSFLIVIISAQYKVTLQISVFTILFLRHLHSSQSSPWKLFPPGKGFFPIAIQGRQSWGLRVATPRFWAGGHREGRREVVGVVLTGREILLYLIMYRKYVRKWLLLKRNRIICPEVAVNGQLFAWKIDFFSYLKKSKFSEICLQISIFFCKIA